MQSDVARRGVIESEIIEPGYGVAHKTFHWVVFALIAAEYVDGSVMPHIGKNTQNVSWVHWHFIIGAAVMFFIFWRLVWRLMPIGRRNPDSSVQVPTIAPQRPTA